MNFEIVAKTYEEFLLNIINRSDIIDSKEKQCVKDDIQFYFNNIVLLKNIALNLTQNDKDYINSSKREMDVYKEVVKKNGIKRAIYIRLSKMVFGSMKLMKKENPFLIQDFDDRNILIETLLVCSLNYLMLLYVDSMKRRLINGKYLMFIEHNKEYKHIEYDIRKKVNRGFECDI